MSSTMDTLQQKLSTLDEKAIERVLGYVDCLCADNKRGRVTQRINGFLKQNPQAFSEFENEKKVALSRLRELTKNDTW